MMEGRHVVGSAGPCHLSLLSLSPSTSGGWNGVRLVGKSVYETTSAVIGDGMVMRGLPIYAARLGESSSRI